MERQPPAVTAASLCLSLSPRRQPLEYLPTFSRGWVCQSLIKELSKLQAAENKFLWFGVSPECQGRHTYFSFSPAAGHPLLFLLLLLLLHPVSPSLIYPRPWASLPQEPLASHPPLPPQKLPESLASSLHTASLLPEN
jgi:hypothetical protein